MGSKEKEAPRIELRDQETIPQDEERQAYIDEWRSRNDAYDTLGWMSG